MQFPSFMRIDKEFDKWIAAKIRSTTSESQGREILALSDELREAYREGFKTGFKEGEEEERAWMRTNRA